VSRGIVQESICPRPSGQTGPPSCEWLEVNSCVAATRPARVTPFNATARKRVACDASFDIHERVRGEMNPMEDFS
jgi:hypothetical protein